MRLPRFSGHRHPHEQTRLIRVHGLRGRKPKDAFDILYAVRHYDGGVKAAVAQFAVEGGTENAAFDDARNSLRQNFLAVEASGPVRAAHFLLGEIHANENEDTRLRRAQIKQDTISAALELESGL